MSLYNISLFVTKVLVYLLCPILQVCVVSFSASFVYHNIKRKREGQWGRPRPWMKERKGLFGEVGACHGHNIVTPCKAFPR